MMDMTVRELLDLIQAHFSNLTIEEMVGWGVGVIYLFAFVTSKMFYRSYYKECTTPEECKKKKEARIWTGLWVGGAPVSVPLFTALMILFDVLPKAAVKTASPFVKAVPFLLSPLVAWWEKDLQPKPEQKSV